MRKLRFAQAGVSLTHANMYRDTLMLLSDEIELVGFYDPDPDAVQPNLKADVEHVPFYTSLDDLISKARPEAVMVSAYPNIMPDWLLQIAEAGVHIWAEKPVACHSSQLAPVAAAIAKNELHFSTGYSWRFHPISRLINSTYADGLLGQPYSIDMRFSTSSVKRRDPTSWVFQREISGGGILNWLGCHWFDLMRFITGSEVTKVSAIEANVGGEAIDIEDAATVSMQFDNGMIGSLHAGYFTSGGGDTSFGLYGSQGWAKWAIADESCTIKSDHPEWAEAPERAFSFPSAKYPGYGAEGRALVKAFAAAIRGEGISGYTVDDAIQTLRIIETAHESAESGRTITLPE